MSGSPSKVQYIATSESGGGGESPSEQGITTITVTPTPFALNLYYANTNGFINYIYRNGIKFFNYAAEKIKNVDDKSKGIKLFNKKYWKSIRSWEGWILDRTS